MKAIELTDEQHEFLVDLLGARSAVLKAVLIKATDGSQMTELANTLWRLRDLMDTLG